MLRVIEASGGALNMAGSLSGVPFVGAAAIIVQEIVKTCDEIKAHKKKARQMSNRCISILNTISDQSEKLDSSELHQIIDQLTPILDKIRNRVNQWSAYGKVMTWFKNGEIKEALEKFESDLDTAMSICNVLFVSNLSILHKFADSCLLVEMVQHSFNIAMSSQQREMNLAMRSDTAEIRELLYQVLTSPAARQEVVQFQNAGIPIAERLMEAGQKELQLLRHGSSVDHLDSLDSIPRASSPIPLTTEDSGRYLEYQRGLINLHRETGIPPTVKILNNEVRRIGDLAVAGGFWSDIWQGLWLDEEKVALKGLRNIRSSNPKAKQRLEKEIRLWANLKHDNILPFYGIVTDIGQQITIVSPWQENGNVLEYMQRHPDAHRVQLILGAARGLDYLHGHLIIHGNMKCANILVSDKGEARICDFGTAKLIEDVTEKSASQTLTAGGSARWLAPEVIKGEASSPTIEADIYSYAMAVLELLTGKRPYADCKRDVMVIQSIVFEHKLPNRPDNGQVGPPLSDGLWELMTRCWDREPSRRPSMADVTSCIESLTESGI